MNKISETFLLTIAKVSATLLGLLRAPLRSSDVRGAWSLCSVPMYHCPSSAGSSPVTPGPPKRKTGRCVSGAAGHFTANEVRAVQ